MKAILDALGVPEWLRPGAKVFRLTEGSGTATCPLCDGAKSAPLPNGRKLTCGRCNGIGTIMVYAVCPSAEFLSDIVVTFNTTETDLTYRINGDEYNADELHPTRESAQLAADAANARTANG